MRHFPRSLTAIGFALLASTVALDAHAYEYDDVEEAHQANYLATSVDLTGRIVDELGAPIEGAQLTLVAWGDNIANDGEAATTVGTGSFTVADLARRNALVEIDAPGYYSEVVPLNLQVVLEQEVVDLGDITLTAEQFGRARLSFGGDVMFDRRMYDEGVIAEGSFGADTRAIFQYVEGLFRVDDHTNVNFETAVTDEFDNIADTPHPSKSYVFGAHPDTVSEFPGLSIDSVALGNNHIYDYLTKGIEDTLVHLDAIGLPYMGAGMSRSEARATTYRPDINGVGITMQSFGNMTGTSYGDQELWMIAYDDPDKAGGLPSYSSEIDRWNEDETNLGRFTIPIIHGGTEYAYVQSSGTRNDFERFINGDPDEPGDLGGSDLIIAHHPHVAHGVSIINGDDGDPHYVFGSLGNLAFDQTIYETFQSYLAIVDVVDTGDGPEVDRIRLAPFRIDDYVPRLLAGESLERFGRTLAHYSTEGTEVNGFERAVIFAENGQLVVAENENVVTTVDHVDARNTAVSGGLTPALPLLSSDVDVGNHALAGIATSAPASCEVGRNLLVEGSFEELDVDDAYAEDGRWNTSSARYLQGSETHTGTGAAVLVRRDSNSGRTSLYLNSSVNVEGGRNITVRGWHKGQNAGRFLVQVRWYVPGSDDYEYFNSTDSDAADYNINDGTFDWTPFEINLTAPHDASDIKVYYRHYPPADGTGEGQMFLDDLEYIEWDEDAIAVDPQGVDLATPNAWDHVRCAADDGDLDVTLTRRTYEL